MTATLTQASGHDALRGRLTKLYADRDAALAETATDAAGDAADRATNVDAHVRLAMLEERIMDLEATLSGPVEVPADGGGHVIVGSTLAVDFGDGPESFVLTTADLADEGVDVITPRSPLGLAVLGATPGSQVTYTPRPGRKVTVTVVSVS